MSNESTDIKKEQAAIFQEQFQAMLEIPANQLSLSIMFMEVALKAMKQQQIDEIRRSTLPVVVRTYYPGSIKAVVKVVGADTGKPEMDVDLFEENEGKAEDWVTLTVPEEFQKPLKQLILSQATHDGDVWYLTTSSQVNQVLDKVAEQYLKHQQK